MTDSNKKWPSGWDQHRAEQIKAVARETTPKERLQWLEEMLDFMKSTGKSYQERKRLFKTKQIT